MGRVADTRRVPLTNWETRPYRNTDADAIRTLLRATFDRGELPGRPWYDVERLLDSMSAFPSETIVGLVDETVVGFVAPHHQQLVVHPTNRRRGVGTRLVEAALAFARVNGDAVLTLAPPPGRADAETFASRLGFAYDRSLWLLRLSPDREVPAPVFPVGVAARTFEPDEDIPRYVGLINSAFIDHPSPIFVSIEAVERAHAQPGWEPDGIHLLTDRSDPATPIAFCRARIDIDDAGQRIGEISLIGVAATWRGRGLGRELLRWGVMYLRDRAVDDLTLHVEAKNDRALGLYERAGFVRGQEWPCWSRPVPQPR